MGWHTGGVYGASVMFGESLKLFIDDRFVTVAAGDDGFQVVRHYGHGSAAKEMQRVLTGTDEVFLALEPHGLAISVVAAWQDGNEHLSLPGTSRELVSHLKTVTREINVHLVSCIMIYMSDCLCLKHVPPEQDIEISMTVTVRMPLTVFLEELTNRDTLLPQAGGIFRKEHIQFAVLKVLLYVTYPRRTYRKGARRTYSALFPVKGHSLEKRGHTSAPYCGTN